MSEFFVKKYEAIPKLVNPVLIEGLPGIGNVARLSVDYLVDKLEAKKFMEFFSDTFPNSVTISDDSLIKMFSIEFYHVRVEGEDLIFISGDVQPTGDAESYAMCNKIVELVKDLGVKELITIGGIGLPELPDKVRVHAVLNHESLKKSLNDLDLVFDGNDTVKIILGATGLLLGVAKLRGMKGFSLLAETLNQSHHVGIKESREVLKILTKYLGFKLDFKELDEEIKNYEAEIKEEQALAFKATSTQVRQGYIG